jgi:predicted dehydrogenase
MLDVLIVGAGNIAGGFDDLRAQESLPFSHAGAYRRHGGYRLGACVEPDAARRQHFMERWQVEEGFGSIEEALASSRRYDVISICSPTATHDAAIEAAVAMKPRLIFCEKPVTPSLERTLAMSARCTDAGIPLVVNYSRRWDPFVRTLGTQIREGKWGAVRSASAMYTKGVLNNGSHLFDLLGLLLGPLSVQAAGRPIDDMWSDDPSVPAMLLARNGIPVSVSCGFAQDFALFELQIVFEAGIVSREDGGFSWRLRHVVDSETFQGYRGLDRGETVAGTLAQAMLGAVEEIHSSLTQGGAFSSTAENAIAAQRICETVMNFGHGQNSLRN